MRSQYFLIEAVRVSIPDAVGLTLLLSSAVHNNFEFKERPVIASSALCGRVWAGKHYRLCESRPLPLDLLLCPE